MVQHNERWKVPTTDVCDVRVTDRGKPDTMSRERDNSGMRDEGEEFAWTDTRRGADHVNASGLELYPSFLRTADERTRRDAERRGHDGVDHDDLAAGEDGLEPR